MGGSVSKTTVSSLSATITDVVSSSVQSCEVSATQSQSLVVKNTGFKLWGNYKLEQKTDISSKCFSDVNKQTEIQNKIVSAVSQASTAEGVALLGAFGSSTAEATANLKNIVKNNITMENIQRSYTAIKNNQAADFENDGVVLFEQIELTQGSKIFAAATLKELDRAGVFNKIESYVDQKATAKTENPLDFIAKALGALGSSAMTSIIFFLIVISVLVFGAVFVIKALNGGSNGATDTQSNSGQSWYDRL